MKSLPTSHDVIINVFIHLPGHKIAATSPDFTDKTRPHPAKEEGFFFFFEQENLSQKYLRKYSFYKRPELFPFLFPNQLATGQMESS